MKRLIVLLFGICASLIINAQDINKEDILSHINSVRNDLTNSNANFYEDTLISKTLSNLNKVDDFMNVLSKDSLRAILRENLVYDYQIEFIKLEIDTDKIYENESYLINEDKYLRAINDTAYNRLGILVEIDKSTTNIYLIFTKRYVDFDLNKEITVIPSVDGYIEALTVRICGKSNIKDIFFSLVRDLKNSDIPIKNQLNLKSDNRFNITIDITPYGESKEVKYRYLIITDAENNIISINQFYK